MAGAEVTDIQINLVCCTQVLLQDIFCKEATQKDVALTYAMALKSEAQGADKPDWGQVNRAILARWSTAGLKRIKKLAWNQVSGIHKRPE
jgi:hypothetical protein